MRKATAKEFLIRYIFGDIGQIINARQEISRGANQYGVYWKFHIVSKERFLNELEKDDKIYCIKTISNKFIEVNKDNINLLFNNI